ncbi:hypothetical protein ACE14D_11675 [Streptomyces sp. Act-28]
MATLAPAAHADAPSEDRVRLALQRHADGTWTQEDVDIVRSIPELAGQVMDVTRPDEIVTKEAAFTSTGQAVSPANGEPLTPEQLAEVMPPSTAEPSDPATEVTTPEEVDPEAGGISPRITGGTWKMTHITHTHRSYSGSVIFKYHTYARFNYGGGKVRAWGQRYDDVTNTSVDVKIEPKLIVNTKSSVPASYATSQMKRQVELCVFKYGCYATLHPWAKVGVYGSGKTKIVGSGV